MKHLAAYLAWTAAAVALIVGLAHPAAGVIYTNPGVMLAVGLIGLGLCKDARKRFAAQPVAARTQR